MKFSRKLEDGTSNESLNFGSDPWPWQRFVLSECTLRAKIWAPSASSFITVIAVVVAVVIVGVICVIFSSLFELKNCIV